MIISENKLKSLTVDQLNTKYNNILEGEIDRSNLQTLLNYETHITLNRVFDESPYQPLRGFGRTTPPIEEGSDNIRNEDSVSRAFLAIMPSESEYAQALKLRLHVYPFNIPRPCAPEEAPEPFGEYSYKESFCKKHLVFKKTLDVIRSSLSDDNGGVRSNISLIDTESVGNFIMSDLRDLAAPYSPSKKHLFLNSVCPGYNNVANLKEYNDSLSKLSEKVGEPVDITESLSGRVAETLQYGGETFADLERSIFASMWLKPAKLLKDHDFNLSAKQLAEVFNTLEDPTTTFNAIFSFTKQYERLALVTIEPYLYKVMGYSQFLKYFPVLHKPGILTLLLSVTKNSLIDTSSLGQPSPIYLGQSSPFYFLNQISSITPMLDFVLNNTIPLGGFSVLTAILVQYGKKFWQNRLKEEDENSKSSVEEILDQTLTDGGFNSALLNASKIFTGKLGHELGGLIGIFSASFVQGFLYKHKETLRIVAKKVDSKLESLEDD
jgi:hypothetical protein